MSYNYDVRLFDIIWGWIGVDNSVGMDIRPSAEEKKKIRRGYFFAALVIFIDIVIFQGISRLILLITALVNGMGTDIAAANALVRSNDVISVLYSCGFPIVAEITAIVLGYRLLHIDIKKQLSRDGYSGMEITGALGAGFFAQTTAILMLAVIVLIFIKGDTSRISNDALLTKSSLGANILMYSYVCLLGPVLEELLFRGIVLESMRRYNERFAIVFSAMMFGLMHGNLGQAVNGFICGLVLGTIYVRSRSLIPSSIVHIFMNTVTSVSAVMLASEPDMLQKGLDLSALSTSGFAMAGLIFNGVIRLLSIPVGIIVIVYIATHGLGLRKANEAGKSRSAPIVFTTPLWIVNIVLYLAICVYNTL